MSAPAEVELKLAIVAGSAKAVRRALGQIALRRTVLEAVYFDTPQADLAKRGLVLRVRREGDRWVQTLKAAGRRRQLVPERSEWEVELGSGRKRPPLDLERFSIAPLRLLMRADLQPDQLSGLFRTRVTRYSGEHEDGPTRVEIAIDDGEILARVSGRVRRLPLSEVELELKDGRSEELLSLALSLVNRRSSEYRLVPALRTKAERGYSLALGTGPAVARANARGFVEHVLTGMRTGEALRAVVRHGVAVVVANADALREAPEAEHVHQARVALRRMRSAIRCFDPAGHDLPKRLASRLHWLAQALGSARDWDVVLDSSLPTFLAHRPLSDNARKALVKATRRARTRALGGAVRAVSSRRYAKLVLELAQWASTPASPSCDPLSRAAAPLLDDAADQLFSHARSFARHTANQRHEVRIRAKRLRYALDLLAVTLPERPVHDYIEALSELQDVLGELNDVVVAVECISGLDRGRRMKAALHDWLEQAEAAQLGAARRKLNALARRSRPWKSP